jgi:hypothetical protein
VSKKCGRWDSNPVTDLAEYLVVLLDGPAVALQGGGEGHAQHHLPAPALKPARLPANRGRNEGTGEKFFVRLYIISV